MMEQFQNINFDVEFMQKSDISSQMKRWVIYNHK